MTIYSFKSLLIVLLCSLSTLGFGQIGHGLNKEDGEMDLLRIKEGTFKASLHFGDFQEGLITTEQVEINLSGLQERCIGIKNSMSSPLKRRKKIRSRFAFNNPHDTRYFFGPSGIPIKKGGGYYQNIYVFFNFANYGITDNISIGGGIEFISTITGNPIWFLTPKAGFRVGDFMHLGGGVIAVGYGSEFVGTMGYGVATYGTGDSNMSAGLGYGFVNGQINSSPVMVLSGMHRIRNSLSLLMENYIFISTDEETSSDYIGIFGMRYLTKKIALDMGGVIIPEISDIFPILPYVGFVRTF